MITDLTDAEISRWIAEKLEPVARLPVATEPIITDERGNPSPMKCWFETSEYESGDEPFWQPRDFVNDPAMTMMLIERGLLYVGPQDGSGYWNAKSRLRQWKGARCKSLGRAVAEAFMLANGWME